MPQPNPPPPLSKTSLLPPPPPPLGGRGLLLLPNCGDAYEGELAPVPNP